MYILSGFLTGLLVGLTGVGGGSLMTPILLLFFGVAPGMAVGTDLWFAALTKMVGGGVHWKKDLIDWQVLRRMWWGSLPSSALMIVLIHYGVINLDVGALKQVIGYLVIITAIGILFQEKIKSFGRYLRLSDESTFKYWQPSFTILAGVILGVLVTLTSIGAGALGVVMLSYLYPLRLTPVRLIATDIVHAIPLALFAGMGHFLIGQVNFELLGVLLVGSIPGVYLGAKLSPKLPVKLLRMMLAIVLLAVSSKLIWM
ncbi:sulfite exporter TauE/SafE family protein [Polynucleobacter paneuropaeus]|nr:sulfite exporter TauE/SafE family protein [Polynucleobacter paneuropaeus]MBT8530970.1 sulfite exporter TauE/SafE family protein [Polynucleobacter paneuropaeus]MBT8602473.1 sulfite exporter TauE/SafE family protein [Polynucleobacter paneuropaeus]MBT8624426.1 sulfite exporter TauE/SafE family protein [Polynucleobacter paneuropaeus]MBT8628689.1 sulfite exporter TauE/SafE family protein [Polynucleobacter paneuropaeus]